MAVIRDVMPVFELLQPTSVDSALELVDRHGAGAWILAGGLDSFDWLKDRIKRPSVVVDLSGVAELKGVRTRGDGLEIGAMTTLTEVVRHPEVQRRFSILNEAAEAESICRDVLRVDPTNDRALVLLLLALTDQFDRGLPDVVGQALALVPKLSGEYERSYYMGIICERRAKTYLQQHSGGSSFNAYDKLSEAMRWYEKAESIRPPGNDDALLRWNTCARLIMQNKLVARTEEPYEPSLE